MSEKYKVVDSSIPHFITLTVINWIDLFTRQEYIHILNRSLSYCIQEKGLVIHAYVFMTNHIHLIVQSRKEEISNIIRDFKKFTNKEIIRCINEIPESRREWLLEKFSQAANDTQRAKNYKIWKDGFHPIVLDNIQKMEQRVRYIHYNPVAAGFVIEEFGWKNSSIFAYMEGREKPPIKVEALW